MADYGSRKFTAAERKTFHNRQAKKGATKTDRVTGLVVPVSDFERGAHKAQADAIHRRQVAYGQRMEALNAQRKQYANAPFPKK